MMVTALRRRLGMGGGGDKRIRLTTEVCRSMDGGAAADQGFGAKLHFGDREGKGTGVEWIGSGRSFYTGLSEGNFQACLGTL